jgi:hypothetical protein
MARREHRARFEPFIAATIIAAKRRAPQPANRCGVSRAIVSRCTLVQASRALARDSSMRVS